MIMGHDSQPGGLNHDPPLACGLGEWDRTGGFSDSVYSLIFLPNWKYPMVEAKKNSNGVVQNSS